MTGFPLRMDSRRRSTDLGSVPSPWRNRLREKGRRENGKRGDNTSKSGAKDERMKGYTLDKQGGFDSVPIVP